MATGQNLPRSSDAASDALAKLQVASVNPLQTEMGFEDKHPEVSNILGTTRKALGALAISGAVAMGNASAMDASDKSMLELRPYGQASGWVDHEAIKVAGGANYEIPVKPEVKELWDFLSKMNREKDIDNYNTLLPDNRKKVVEYFQAGKKEQSDEKALLKGVVPYISLLGMLERGHKALDTYGKTGNLPKETPVGFSKYTKLVAAAFPSAKSFIDEQTVSAIDDGINAIYNARAEQANARAEQNKREIERLQKLIEALSNR